MYNTDDVYHPGERAVQERAGTQQTSSRVAKTIGSVIPSGARDFLTRQPAAVMGSVDGNGRVWASVLCGTPGFMYAVDDRTVRLDAQALAGDPLAANLHGGAGIGMLVIELSSRKRLRLNGRVVSEPGGPVVILADQVYANCPKYIQSREWEPIQPGAPEAWVEFGDTLGESHRQWIRSADTFFIASAHPERGADASHRGGEPGFVQVEDDGRLLFPDYTGNTMFNTLGNITANPQAGLLFLDFERARTLQLSGIANVVWDAERIALFPGAERAVEFRVQRFVETAEALPLRWSLRGRSPFNPPLS